MRQFLDPELLSELLVSLLYRVENDALHLRIGSLFLKFLDLQLLYLLCPLCSLLESALVDSIASPLIPTTSYLRCIDFASQLVFNLLIFLLLELLHGLLLILGNKQVSHSLILLRQRYNLLLLSLETLQVFCHIK